MMTSQPTAKRSAQNAGTAKILIMVVSLAMMLGGWGALAAKQVQNGANAPLLVQAPPAPALRQVTIPSVQTGPIARTRSSR